MASYDIKKDIDTYFHNNWADTPIQFHGQNLDTTGMDDFISLIYSPIENDIFGFDGTSTGRIGYFGMQKIFCYAVNPTLALKLADDIKTFFNGKELDDISVNIGQDSMPTDLGNGFYEVLCSFNIEQWTKVQAPIDCSLSVGGTDGTAYNLAGTWQSLCIMFKS